MRKLVIAFAAVLIAVVVAFIFSFFWLRDELRDVSKWLPKMEPIAGTQISAAKVQLFGEYAARHFHFSAPPAEDATAAARLFEPMLTNDKWKKTAICESGTVTAALWHHEEKLDGNLRLALTVSQLNDRGKYLVTMVTIPYFENP